MIKKIIAIIFILLLSTPAFAETEITFKWSPNPEKEEITAYWIYARIEDSTDFTIIEIPVGDLSDPANPSYTKSFTDGTWYFSLAAKNSHSLSGRTEEIDSYLLPPKIPDGFSVTVRVTVEFNNR